MTGGLVLLSGADDVRDQADSRARFVLIIYDVAIKQFVFAARLVDEERTTPYIYQEATSYICQLQQGLVLLYSILIQLNCVSICSTALHVSYGTHFRINNYTVDWPTALVREDLMP